MKNLLFCATVAFSCCAASICLSQSDLDSELEFSDPPSNPFDFPASQVKDLSPPPNASPSTPAAPQQEPATQQPVATQHGGAYPPRAHGVPPQAHGSPQQPMVDLSVLAHTPHVKHTPINWAQQVQTPNPIADILLREYCSQGLWNGYEQERAAECAHMAKKLAGGCCGKCTQCNQCNTAPSACSACSGQGHNRYQAQSFAMPQSPPLRPIHPMHARPQQTHCAFNQIPPSQPPAAYAVPQFQQRLVRPNVYYPNNATGGAIAIIPSQMQR